MGKLNNLSMQSLKKAGSLVGTIFLLLIFLVCFEIYVPANPGSHETITFTVQKGWGDDEIALNLQEMGIIKSPWFFKLYVVLSLKHSMLQAGDYSVSPKMSIHQIASNMAQGNVIRDELVILEGWNKNNIAKYLEFEGICAKDYFLFLLKEDYSNEFDFLKDKPKNIDLDGYLFPDTYEIGKGATCEDVLENMLSNFGRKLTLKMRQDIASQKKSIFDIVTMASLIEKEVRGISDKKIVSGILWKRISIDMPLQVDATIVYVTGKTPVSYADLKINSPYNTYKYYGLPKGPISNPGMDSITAAIHPTKTNYWYYLSDGITHFSSTLEEHNIAKAKYLD